MIDTPVLILLGMVTYTVGGMALQRYGFLPPWLDVSGPITKLDTERGEALLDRLARHRRFWRAFANVGIGFGLLVMAGLFLTIIVSAIVVFQQPGATPIQEPRNALVIPGVNEFLPLSAAPEIIFGLVVAMIVHEGGHGLLCRVEDIEIESIGLLFLTVIPLGAFVGPDEESQADADRGAKTRMFAAGVTNNFVVTALALLLLFGPVAGSISAVDGVAAGGVLPGSPAEQAGIEEGDVITSVNESIVKLQGGETVPIERSVTVTAAIADGPLDLSANETITAVNGTVVETVADFGRALDSRTTVTLETDDGAATTGPIGAYASSIVTDGPLANASAPAGEPIVVTRIGNRRILGDDALFETLDGMAPGEHVEVEAHVDGRRKTYDVTLGQQPSGAAFLGVERVQTGHSGVVVSDFGFGVREYPNEWVLGVLGGDGPGFELGEQLLWLFISPFLSFFDSTGFGFTGFDGYVTGFFTVDGALSVLGGGVFVLADLLFWTAWINFSVGLFNLTPLYPLDGGHILRTGAEAIVTRSSLNRRWGVKAVTGSVGLIMFASLVIMLLRPFLAA